jgi:hypothetical protein
MRPEPHFQRVGVLTSSIRSGTSGFRLSAIPVMRNHHRLAKRRSSRSRIRPRSLQLDVREGSALGAVSGGLPAYAQDTTSSWDSIPRSAVFILARFTTATRWRPLRRYCEQSSLQTVRVTRRLSLGLIELRRWPALTGTRAATAGTTASERKIRHRGSSKSLITLIAGEGELLQAAVTANFESRRMLETAISFRPIRTVPNCNRQTQRRWLR